MANIWNKLGHKLACPKMNLLEDMSSRFAEIKIARDRVLARLEIKTTWGYVSCIPRKNHSGSCSCTLQTCLTRVEGTQNPNVSHARERETNPQVLFWRDEYFVKAVNILLSRGIFCPYAEYSVNVDCDTNVAVLLTWHDWIDPCWWCGADIFLPNKRNKNAGEGAWTPNLRLHILNFNQCTKASPCVICPPNNIWPLQISRQRRCIFAFFFVYETLPYPIGRPIYHQIHT